MAFESVHPVTVVDPSTIFPETYKCPAVVKLEANTGGDESCDFASMLLHMYQRYCERLGYRLDVLSQERGECVGLKGVTFSVDGPYAYGYFRPESGVHRLVRISPHDSLQRRHTSLVSVVVMADTREPSLAPKGFIPARSYVFSPYQLAYDHRIQFGCKGASNLERVMDGDIVEFTQRYVEAEKLTGCPVGQAFDPDCFDDLKDPAGEPA